MAFDSKAWRKANREHINQYARRWRANNREHMRRYFRKWHAERRWQLALLEALTGEEDEKERSGGLALD